ncbi:MAG: hypothetical protein ACRDOE_01240 [Streptosporangiaceae bacterium]
MIDAALVAHCPRCHTAWPDQPGPVNAETGEPIGILGLVFSMVGNCPACYRPGDGPDA